jgi:predicted acylesterase/phospholipase RssA
MAHITHVIFGGGGFAGIVYLGLIRYLQQENISLSHVAGTSIGSVFALIYTLGIHAHEFEKVLKRVLPSITHLDLDWMKWIDTAGFTDGSEFMRLFDGLVSPSMTFLDHAKQTGKHLVVCATHMKSLQPVYFSVDTTPNVLVLDAVKASCALPGVVVPVKIGAEYYVDGGLVASQPVLAFKGANPDNILVVTTFKNRNNKNDMSDEEAPNALNVLVTLLKTTVGQFAVHALIRNQYKNYLTFKSYPMEIIPVKALDYDKCRLEVTEELIDESVAVGYSGAYEFFKQRQTPSQTPE